MKKSIAGLLALLVLACCLAGCGGEPVDLSGRWESVSYYDPDSVTANLESMDLYAEEIALLDPGAMGVCDIMILNDDMTYVMTSDAEKSMALAEEYYRNAFATFYENREQLQEVYGGNFSGMTEEEFNQFYADLYGAPDFDALVSFFVGSAEDYAYLEEPLETGTYRLMLNMIYFTADDTGTEEYVTFRVADGALTLEFEDSTITYAKSE